MCPPGREFNSRHLHPQTPEDSAVFASRKTAAEMKNTMNHQTQTETTPPQDGAVYSELSLKFANRKEVLKSALLGAFIGLAIIVPGVSGSAVAIIFRLYEKLLFALGNLFRRFGECLRFLVPIVLGAFVGLIIGFFSVRGVINKAPFAVIALFAGLMFGAYPSVTDQIKGERLTPLRILLFLLGMAVPISFSLISIFVASEGITITEWKLPHLFVFLCLGFGVAVTQLVPGLSATALLMMAGCFTPLMNSVGFSFWESHPRVFIVYGCLIFGFFAGLLIVSKGLSDLIERRRAPAFFVISGLSLGSITTMFFNPEILEVYAGWTLPSAKSLTELIIGLTLFAAGAAIAYAFVRFERRHAAVENS